MPAPKPRPKRSAAESTTDPAVETFLSALDHPLKKAIDMLRRIILAASPTIREGIKWNSPSFRTTDYFATLNLRGKGDDARLWLILHTGAKAKGLTLQDRIADPAGLLKWLAKDRALITFSDAKEVKAKKAALESVIREWIARL